MAVLRRPVRSRPIRLFLISMFAIPLVSLVGLWVFAASVTVPEAVSDHDYNVSTSALDTEGRALAVELPTERAETYLWLLSGRQVLESVPAGHEGASERGRSRPQRPRCAPRTACSPPARRRS